MFPWLPDTCRFMVLLGASHQEGNVCVMHLLLVLFPIFPFCIAIDWSCAGWLTLIDSVFTAFNWFQVHHPLPSTLSRLLLIAISLFHNTIYCYLPSHQLFSFPLLSFLPPLCPLLPLLLICQCLSFCSHYLPALLHHKPVFSPWSWWNLCLPQCPFSLPPVFALSVLSSGGTSPPPCPPCPQCSPEPFFRGCSGDVRVTRWRRWEWEKARVKSRLSYSTRNKTASVCALEWECSQQPLCWSALWLPV